MNWTKKNFFRFYIWSKNFIVKLEVFAGDKYSEFLGLWFTVNINHFGSYLEVLPVLVSRCKTTKTYFLHSLLVKQYCFHLCESSQYYILTRNSQYYSLNQKFKFRSQMKSESQINLF